jgi:putative salt-induced outer membrane protein YdiY
MTVSLQKILPVLLFSIMILGYPGYGADSWEDFDPPEDTKYDWIQLTSGEWLKGDFKVMYDGVVEFDSDELDLQEFDLDDVKQLRTRDPQTVRIEAGWRSMAEENTDRGRLVLNEGKMLLIDGEEERTYSRREIVAIAAGVQRERDFWSGSVSLGITARGGNTETVDSTAMINVKRRKASNRFIADYIGNFSEAGGTETANNHRLTGTYDWFLTTRLFWRIAGASYYRDPFSNIDNQYSIGTAIGYDFVRGPRVEWDASAGAGYQQQEFVSVPVGEDDSVDTPFFIGSTVFDWEVTGAVDFLAEYSFRVLNEVSGTYTHHALAKVSTEFIGDLDIDVSLIWDYIDNPQAKDDGSVPKQSDYQLVFGLAYDF